MRKRIENEKREKGMNNAFSEVGEDATQFGEFVSSYFAN